MESEHCALGRARARWSLVLAAGSLLVGGCYGETTRVQGTTPYAYESGYAPGYGSAPSQGLLPTMVQGDYMPPGTRLYAVLDQSIGPRTPPGTRFSAHLAAPVVDPQGRAILPPGTQIVGTVADVQPARYDQPASVALSVDGVVVNGVEHPLPATIAGTDVQAPHHGLNPIYIGGGAVGGGILGAILGGVKGALIGGALGAGAGTLISLGTSGREAELPRGTALAVDVRAPVPVAELVGPRYG